MKDKSKRLTVVNTGKKPSEKKEVQQIVVQPSSSSSSHAPGFNPNLYLLKSVWDSVFEIKTDVSGQKYIFGKLPVVTKYGITMYADDGNVDIPQLAEGLPYDQRTIWFNPETKQIEVIGGTGGGEGGVSNFWDLSGIPSWITNAKPSYNYSEIKNTPDLSVFVTGTALSNTLANYATLSYLTGELKKYVTLDGAQDITGIKDFINGLKIGGIELIKKQDDVVYLDANLVVRGGITMYGDGEGGSSVPLYSTLGSLLNVDESNDAVASVDRVLFQSAGSNVWSWKALSEIGGGSVSGDYLPLSGGTITGNLLIKQPVTTPVVGFIGSANSGTSYYYYGYLGFETQNNPIFMNSQGSTYSLLHAGNYTYYTLPLSGGTLTGGVVIAPSASYTTAITDNCTVLKLGSDTSGINGYNSGLGFNALQRYSSVYLQHLHAWIGLSPCINSAGSELYDLVFATNGSTTANTSPIERMRITHDGSVKIQKLFFGNTNEINSTDGTFLCLNYEGTGGILMSNNGQGVVVASGWSNLSSVIQQRLRQCMFSVRGGIFSYMEDVISKAAAFVFDKPGMHFTGIGSNGEADTIYFGAVDTSNCYSWVSYSQIWKFGGSIITTGGITMYSDQRKKTILNHVELSLKQIADAPLIEHYYNSDQNKTTHVGSIAQYWAQINDWFCKLDNEGFYTMEIQNCALASAISIARHLEKYESKTDKTIRKMKKRIQELEDEVERLKKGE